MDEKFNKHMYDPNGGNRKCGFWFGRYEAQVAGSLLTCLAVSGFVAAAILFFATTLPILFPAIAVGVGIGLLALGLLSCVKANDMQHFISFDLIAKHREINEFNQSYQQKLSHLDKAKKNHFGFLISLVHHKKTCEEIIEYHKKMTF